MAMVVKIDGTTEELGFGPKLPALQKAVGGYIEAVRLPDGHLMYVNEEGRSNGLDPNTTASLMAAQMILGDVVILTPKRSKPILAREQQVKRGEL